MGFENSGRRPKPTALKVLLGTARKDRLNPLEPKVPEGEVEKPDTLSVEACRVWDSVAPVLLYMGTLTPADQQTFVAYCELQAAFTYQAQLRDLRPGDFNPRLLGDLANKLRPFFDYFGMTPSGRARLSVPRKKQDEEPQSKWAGSLK